MAAANIDALTYFHKLAPDFSVFGLVEKYMIDNNIFSYNQGLFFYKDESQLNVNSIETINLRRGMILINLNNTKNLEDPLSLINQNATNCKLYFESIPGEGDGKSQIIFFFYLDDMSGNLILWINSINKKYIDNIIGVAF